MTAGVSTAGAQPQPRDWEPKTKSVGVVVLVTLSFLQGHKEGRAGACKLWAFPF